MDPAALARETVANLKQIGAIGRQFGVGFYIEPLAWTPLCNLSRILEILADAEQDNVGLAIDFWHLWNTGVEPDDVARIDGKVIRSVDVCDAIGPPGACPAPINAAAASGLERARSPQSLDGCGTRDRIRWYLVV